MVLVRQYTSPVLSVTTACYNDLRLVCCTSTACPDSFLSSHGDKHPDPKSGWDPEPDKPDLQVYAAEPLPGDDCPMPYFLIRDDAFSLCTWLMKAFSCCGFLDAQRIFNYRRSRARWVVVNAFGILANRFGCLLTTMDQNTYTVSSVVLACCVLHNMRIRYPGLHQCIVDNEDDNHRLVP